MTVESEGDCLTRTAPTSRSTGDRVAMLVHPVDRPELLRLLREQLRRTLHDGVARIGKGGARGVLFQVTLLAYGYTFLSKGTVEEFVEDLEHEATVDHRLQPLQGV
ncbi:hypothetical protein F5883DRAFT_637700 [Diaporthe sp. PMI_573]|nr:hypothetical protein F5883DRAFT_637700 [Diaporthaceae sp. PMI_573]